MRNKGKKLTALLLTGSMLASLTACGQTGNTGNESQTNESSQGGTSATVQEGNKTEDKYNEPGTFPIARERQKLTVGITKNSQVMDYETNAFTKMIEDNVNVDIEFVFFPESDSSQKFSIMANSGSEMPDVVIGYDLCKDAYSYGEAGLFIPLNDYYADPEIAYQFNSRIPEEDRSFMLNYSTSPDGNIYFMGSYAPAIGNEYPWRYWMNQTWLDNLGLEMPKTTDEFYEVLKAFKNDDPNGNGKKDEIPLTGSTNGWCQPPQVFLMNAFIYANKDQKYLTVENGRLDIAYNKEEWKQGLEYMNKLCQEGLLDPVSFTQDVNQYKALLENPSDQIIGCMAGSITAYMTDSERKKDMVPLEPLTGPGGTSLTPYSPSPVYQDMAITKYCKDPELAFRMGDYLYEETASMNSRYGVKGVDWTDEGLDGLKGVYEDSLGIKCGFREINNIWNQEQNSHWRQNGPAYRKGELGDMGTALVDPQGNAALIAQSVGLYVNHAPAETAYRLLYTTEEQEEVADIYTSLESVRDESMVRFITGDRPFSEWDSYIKELNACGLERYLELSQTAYDRAMGK